MHCQKNSCHLPWIFEIHVDILCMGRSFPKQIIAETISSNEIHKIVHLKIAINEFLCKKIPTESNKILLRFMYWFIVD